MHHEVVTRLVSRGYSRSEALRIPYDEMLLELDLYEKDKQVAALEGQREMWMSMQGQVDNSKGALTTELNKNAKRMARLLNNYYKPVEVKGG